jgi:hypothetical protein
MMLAELIFPSFWRVNHTRMVAVPTTAYSTYFRCELDVEQLLAKMGKGSSPVPLHQLDGLDPLWREWIKKDIRCPSCGVAGATLISGAVAKRSGKALRQAHFRFQAGEHNNGHLRYCDFELADRESKGVESLVALGGPRNRETRYIRYLVCIGIEQGMFSQADIRAMRQWFFENKQKSRFVVTCAEENIDYITSMPSSRAPALSEFFPPYGEIPSFNWRHAAISRFIRDNGPWLTQLDSLKTSSQVANRAKELITRYKQSSMFDVSILQPYYGSTIELAVFFARECPEFGLQNKYHAIRWGASSNALLAFCALLLYVTQWKFESAIALMGAIMQSPEPKDLLAGNIIGLNPFHDYAAWKLIRDASDISVKWSVLPTYKEGIDASEVALREEHRLWKLTQI